MEQNNLDKIERQLEHNSPKDDYLSGVYVFAVSNPDYLHNVLPAAQIT